MTIVVELFRRRVTPIVLGCLVVVLAVWWFAWMAPEGNAVTSDRANEAMLKATRSALVLRLGELQRDARQAKQQRAFLGRFQAAIPSRPDAAGLVVEVYNLAVGDGVKLSSITDDSVLGAGSYSTIPVSIDVTGSHTSVEHFVSGLYNIPRLLTIQSLVISGSASGTEAASASTSATISATAYTLEAVPASNEHA